MKKKRMKTTTIVLENSVYAQLKDRKIIPEESFNSVIKKLLLENETLKGVKYEPQNPQTG